MQLQIYTRIFFTLLAWSIATDGMAIEIAKRPLIFVDSSGSEIETYCVAPLYGRSYGIGWGPEASGRKHSAEHFLMWPTIVKKGEKFSLRASKRKGIDLLPLIVTYGESFEPGIFLIIKKGYLPLLWDSYIDVTKTKSVQLEKGNSENVIKTLIAEKPEQETLRKIFHLNNDEVIIDSYSNADRALLYNCYYSDSAL